MKKKQHTPLVFTPILIFVIAFVLNFIWEFLHFPLYSCPLTVGTCAPIAAFRDALIIIGIYFGGTIIFNKSWIFNLTPYHISILLLASFLIAYIIELQGLYLNKWDYASSMPIIPFINVGLSPIVQMLILPFATFFATKRIMIDGTIRGSLIK